MPRTGSFLTIPRMRGMVPNEARRKGAGGSLRTSGYLQAAGQTKIRADAPGREQISDCFRMRGVCRRETIRPGPAVIRHRRIVEFEAGRVTVVNLTEVALDPVVHAPRPALNMVFGELPMARFELGYPCAVGIHPIQPNFSLVLRFSATEPEADNRRRFVGTSRTGGKRRGKRRSSGEDEADPLQIFSPSTSRASFSTRWSRPS